MQTKLSLCFFATVWALLGSFWTAGPAAAAPQRETAPPTINAIPRLVVLIVIDQLPSWALESRLPLLSEGIAHLVNTGVYFSKAQFEYASTFTAPGHAALVTGAAPVVSGIVANGWYDRSLGMTVSSVYDPTSPIVGAGRVGTSGASPRNLRAETIGDVLRAATANVAKVVAVSIKDRAAILAGGRRANLAVWYDARQGRFVTSKYYRDRWPSWLVTTNRKQVLSKGRRYVWRPLTRRGLRDIGDAHEDVGAPRSDPLGSVFPRWQNATTARHAELQATPLADELTLAVARAAIIHEHLGADETPDLLVVSLSTLDHVAHTWGQESWQALDTLRRADHEIGRLLTFLDRRIGSSRYAVLLTSDHGAAHLVEASRRSGVPSYRITSESIKRTARRSAEQLLGKGRWIVACQVGTLYLSTAALQLPLAKRNRLLAVLTNAIAAMPGMAYAVVSQRYARQADGCSAMSARDALICRSLFPGRGGEVVFGAKEDSVIVANVRQATNHGSLNVHDRTVPVVVWAPWVRPRRVRKIVSAMSVAPTLAQLLGVRPPTSTSHAPLRLR